MKRLGRELWGHRGHGRARGARYGRGVSAVMSANSRSLTVMPAKTCIQAIRRYAWTPAFAGVTAVALPRWTMRLTRWGATRRLTAPFPPPMVLRSRRTGTAMAIAGILAFGIVAVAPPLDAQDRGTSLRVELGVEPARVTVGDPFRSMVRIDAPPEYSVRFLEFASGDSLAALAAPALVESGGRTAAIYQLVAWAVAPDLVAPIGIEVTAPDGSTRVHQLRLRLPEVVSVLPADTAGIVPRPARGMIAVPAPSPFPWWLLALLLLALLLAWLLYRYLRRVRGIAEIDPRRWALQQLEDEHLKATLRPGDGVALVAHLSHVLREYIERTHPGLSRDLTTTELLELLGRSPGHGALPKATLLAALLAQSDRVKFARHRPHDAEATDLLTSARAWISRFPEESEAPGETRRAA